MSSEQAKRWLRNAALTAAIALPLATSAQQAVVNINGALYAGPDFSYPLVAQLAPGTPASVMGCVNGYYWCDIVAPNGLRGWMNSGSLNYLYQGSPVPMLSIGAMIGVPIVTFTLGTYWGNYYRDRPWYGQPRWWGGRAPPPPRPGWRPPPPPAPNWRPHSPPQNWRPPAHSPRPQAVRPPAARPQVREQHPPPAPNRRPPERPNRQP